MNRSTSRASTLSLGTIKVNKYQSWLALLNVLILLSSLCLIFYGVILKLYYHLDTLAYCNFNTTYICTTYFRAKSSAIILFFSVSIFSGLAMAFDFVGSLVFSDVRCKFCHHWHRVQTFSYHLCIVHDNCDAWNIR